MTLRLSVSVLAAKVSTTSIIALQSTGNGHQALSLILATAGPTRSYADTKALTVSEVTFRRPWRREISRTLHGEFGLSSLHRALSGRYFARSRSTASSQASYDEESARRLWDASELLVASTA